MAGRILNGLKSGKFQTFYDIPRQKKRLWPGFGVGKRKFVSIGMRQVLKICKIKFKI